MVARRTDREAGGTAPGTPGSDTAPGRTAHAPRRTIANEIDGCRYCYSMGIKAKRACATSCLLSPGSCKGKPGFSLGKRRIGSSFPILFLLADTPQGLVGPDDHLAVGDGKGTVVLFTRQPIGRQQLVLRIGGENM